MQRFIALRPNIWQRRSRSLSLPPSSVIRSTCATNCCALRLFLCNLFVYACRGLRKLRFFAGLASDEQPAIWRNPVDTAPRLRGRLLRGGHPGVGRWSGGNGRGSGPYGSRESDLYGARRPAERDNGGQRVGRNGPGHLVWPQTRWPSVASFDKNQ